MPGYISHAGAIFKRIRNLSEWKNPPRSSFNASSTCQSVDAMVQETDRDSELAMTYQVIYVDGQGKKKYIFLNLGRLLRNLQRRVSTFKCEGSCLDLPTKPLRSVDGPDVSNEISSWRETRRYPVVLFDQAAIGNAQRFVADLHRLSNQWVSTSIKSLGSYYVQSVGHSHYPVKMLSDRPLMIYLSLMDTTWHPLCVFPFTPCLSCMIERGCLTRIYGRMQPIEPSTGLLRLAAPGHTEEEMLWETLMPNPLQESFTVPGKLLANQESQLLYNANI